MENIGDGGLTKQQSVEITLIYTYKKLLRENEKIKKEIEELRGRISELERRNSIKTNINPYDLSKWSKKK